MLGDKKLTFTYDYMGRRVEKVYWIYKAAAACGNESADWCEQSRRRFVYDNWNVILVLDGSNNVKTTYAWGLDLSGLSDNGSAFSPRKPTIGSVYGSRTCHAVRYPWSDRSD